MINKITEHVLNYHRVIMLIDMDICFMMFIYDDRFIIFRFSGVIMEVYCLFYSDISNNQLTHINTSVFTPLLNSLRIL